MANSADQEVCQTICLYPVQVDLTFHQDGLMGAGWKTWLMLNGKHTISITDLPGAYRLNRLPCFVRKGKNKGICIRLEYLTGVEIKNIYRR